VTDVFTFADKTNRDTVIFFLFPKEKIDYAKHTSAVSFLQINGKTRSLKLMIKYKKRIK